MSNYLYILTITQGMASMGRGKAVAHGAHAANLFTYDHYVRGLHAGKTIEQDVMDWHDSAGGFGTTIALDVGTKATMVNTVAAVKLMGFRADIVIDPTYPYEVDAEVFPFIDADTHTTDPINLGHKYVCFREEKTAAYVFGEKEKLEPILSKFGLLSNDTLPRPR